MSYSTFHQLAPPNIPLQWTRDNVTHFAKRKMRAIAARH
jgi:hypothetical protein